MAEVFRGNKTFYEENGRFYSGPDKRIEYDPETYSVISHDSPVAVEVEKKVIVEEKALPTDKNSLKCPKCDFIATDSKKLNRHKWEKSHF